MQPHFPTPLNSTTLGNLLKICLIFDVKKGKVVSKKVFKLFPVSPPDRLLVGMGGGKWFGETDWGAMGEALREKREFPQKTAIYTFRPLSPQFHLDSFIFSSTERCFHLN